jgi:hypothetical protein
MISFCNLGYNGRFGNQMFQYAALMGYAAYSNLEFGIPENNHKVTKTIGELKYKEKFDLSECFNLNYNYLDTDPEYIFLENNELVSLPDKTDINGYFQSEKYFNHIKNDVLKQFSFQNNIVEKSQHYFKDAEQYISVHIRRTDYVNLQDYHPLISKDWYNEAMSLFSGDKFLFFSDDIEWCKNNFSNSNLFSEVNDKQVDLCTMSRCKGHIIANSSFSWWGAYLGQGKTIAPKTWFGPKINNKNDGSIYCKNWIIL